MEGENNKREVLEGENNKRLKKEKLKGKRYIKMYYNNNNSNKLSNNIHKLIPRIKISNAYKQDSRINNYIKKFW